MKKLSAPIVPALLWTLIWFTPASAIYRTGKTAISLHVGHGMGFEGVFEDRQFNHWFPDYGVARVSVDNKLSYSWGARVKTGLTPSLSLVVGWDHQEVIAEATASLDGLRLHDTENFHWNILLVNLESALNTERSTVPNISGGLGMYMPEEGESKPGINMGAGLEHFFRDNTALDLGFRFHLISTEGDYTSYIQFFCGMTHYFGG
jgi:opacity protein-like surface antigen